VWPQTCLDAQDTSKCLNNKWSRYLFERENNFSRRTELI